MVVGLADTLMVSYAGEAVVAGAGLDTMIYTIFIFLFAAISTGGAVVVSQYLGSKDRENGNLAASQIRLQSKTPFSPVLSDLHPAISYLIVIAPFNSLKQSCIIGFTYITSHLFC